MQGPFSGIASALSGVFGGAVTVTPAGGSSRDIQAIFRLKPLDIGAENGVSISAQDAILRASRDLVEDLRPGDVVDPKDGSLYEILMIGKPESPAADALIEIQLELIQ